MTQKSLWFFGGFDTDKLSDDKKLLIKKPTDTTIHIEDQVEIL